MSEQRDMSNQYFPVQSGPGFKFTISLPPWYSIHAALSWVPGYVRSARAFGITKGCRITTADGIDLVWWVE